MKTENINNKSKNSKNVKLKQVSEKLKGCLQKRTVNSACNLKSSVADTKKRKPMKKKRNLWAIKITIVSLFLSAFISFIGELTSTSEQITITVMLLIFLVSTSILFDGIGVAVTSCDIKPLILMASKKVYASKTALWLVKNNEKVSNVCNDVIGDIFGIISGACTAAMVTKLLLMIGDGWQQWLGIMLSSVVASLTIGGKAFLKNIAISNSKEFVMFVARIISIFNKDERQNRKRDQLKKRFSQINKNN